MSLNANSHPQARPSHASQQIGPRDRLEDVPQKALQFLHLQTSTGHQRETKPQAAVTGTGQQAGLPWGGGGTAPAPAPGIKPCRAQATSCVVPRVKPMPRSGP